MFLFSFFHPFFCGLDSERWTIHIDDVSFEGQAVYNCRCNDLVREDLVPLIEAKVCRYDNGFQSGTERYKVEQGLGPLFVKRLVATFIKYRKVLFLKVFLESGQLPLRF